MPLSFLSEIKAALPKYYSGTARLQAINKLLEMNPAWVDEAFEVLQGLFLRMREREASDMDFGGPDSNKKVWFRIYGKKIFDRNLPDFDSDEASALLLSMLNTEQKVIVFKNKNIDISFELVLQDSEKPSRFRVDIYYSRNQLAGNFRRINAKLFAMESLEFPPEINRRFDLRYEKSGLYLITGITGSGKSSTLDTIVDMNNHISSGHIIILAKPVEFIHTSDKCLIRHREMGEDVLNFADGVYQSLRQDPDIIVVGEMRNAKTIATVLEVTDTGHKVFSTLHTSSAIESIHRIIGEFPPNEQERIRNRLADLLRVSVSQKLIPNRRGNFTMVKEILSVNESVKAAIRNNNINELYQMMTEGNGYGMYTLEQDLIKHIRRGNITKDVALNYANNPKRLKQLLSY